MREFVVRRQRAHRYGAPSPPTLHSTPQHPRDLKNLPSSLPPLHPRHFLFFFNPSPSSSLLTATTTTTTGAATRSAAGDKKEKKNIARPRMEGELVLPPPVAHSFFLFFLLPRTWPVGAIPCTRFCPPPPPRAWGAFYTISFTWPRAPPPLAAIRSSPQARSLSPPPRCVRIDRPCCSCNLRLWEWRVVEREEEEEWWCSVQLFLPGGFPP